MADLGLDKKRHILPVQVDTDLGKYRSFESFFCATVTPTLGETRGLGVPAEWARFVGTLSAWM